MKGDIRCIDGRIFRHDPQHDDPNLETDIGECRECDGYGCDRLEALRIAYELADELMKLTLLPQGIIDKIVTLRIALTKASNPT